jgi:2-keto-4-pentenoate hydratase/2-oxohepta-3-ene-1,7-dioic acid hydratase in catechol pathway
MKLATFTRHRRRGIGVVIDDAIIDLAALEPGLPSDMIAFLEAGPSAIAAVRDGAARGAPRTALAEVRIEAPIRRPPKILAVGLNYADHIRETGAARPVVPVIFNKQSTAVIGPGQPILIPPESPCVDYEGELAMVVGVRCRRVPRSQAQNVIAGLTICNDVSVRDWQKRTPTMTMGKSWDSHCPLGPYLVTLDEIPDPQALTLVTRVNGEIRQRASTAEMVFDCWDLVAHLSTAFTLEPGDVISTGTPAGVGMAMTPQRWLRAGDVVSIEVERIGALTNPVAAETPAAEQS